MLKNLTINNIVLIDSLNVELDRGLCVLTGETGSGKSILLDSLGLALGVRANSRLLRSGSKNGFVVAEFDISNNPECRYLLDENALPVHDELVLRRVVYDDGRSKAFVNDVPVGQALLSQIGSTLVEIHGQHEQRGLLNPSMHRELLDNFGGLEELLHTTQNSYERYKEIESELNILKSKRDEAEREEDYLRHIAKEIEDLDPQEGEEEELAEKRNILMNKEKIVSVINSIRDDLESNTNISKAIATAQGQLMRSKGLVEGFGNYNDAQEGNEEGGENNNTAESNNIFENIFDTLERAIIEVNDAVSSLDDLYSQVLEDGGNVDEVEERLFAIRGLARKFNIHPDDLPKFLEEIQGKIKLLENQEIMMGNFERELEFARNKYIENAKLLSKKRHSSAIELEKILLDELAPLKMGNVRFKAEIKDIEDETRWTKYGANTVRFIASTNPGTPLDDISKVASGGELSRFMLGLKVSLSRIKSVPTIIFDEIDTGIGGAVADAVGQRLKNLGDHLQVLVVTHHPQVASKGNHHLRVRKSSTEENTKTIIDGLSNTERLKEIARMLSGENITDEALATAKNMLEGR